MDMITEYGKKVMNGQDITWQEAKNLISLSDEDTPFLLAMADKIRRQYHDDTIDCCSIINGRSGKCPENCKFCAQSSYYKTGVDTYPLLSADEIVAAAKEAAASGIARFAIVTSGRSVKGEEFSRILFTLRRIKAEARIETCCSLGLIDQAQACALKDAGISRYHANIETAPSFFPSLCTTHTFQDKCSVIHIAREAGLRVCSGGIIGLGESTGQRIEMAFTLKELHIDSIPLNILNPVKGTPFAYNMPLSPLTILRTFAVFRFILPQASIRTAGGRELNLRSLQPYALTGGLNGLMVGNYLTTAGQSPEKDLQMIRDLGRKLSRPVLY